MGMIVCFNKLLQKQELLQWQTYKCQIQSSWLHHIERSPKLSKPESEFIFRMKNGPICALFEADGDT
ncbi:hypothetical protein BLMD_11275 [Bacillus paralicheniformis]|nr:hypothetical protein BLMD_11275 [Bacillus paralicheniformis]PAC96289.1 hypothetical protein CHH86_15580 [Bacillus paralicheniformis]POO80564.1 hypothetical protein C1T30_17425 [Bacillus sp. MBGLi97]